MPAGGPASPGGRSSELPTIVTDLSQQSAATASSQVKETRISGEHGVSGRTMTTDLHVEGKPSIASSGSSGSHHHERWGDFELGELLGRGGMGSVYRGRQISLDRKVAIKVLPKHLSENESFRARFQLEAKAVAQINSPHVIQVYYAGINDGHHYFAMEYVEGEDLAKKLKDGFKPSARESLELIIQATRGLVAAGELGIIHRDIKPANMMVSKRGPLKLMDFGLVRLARSDDTGLTMAGTIMGTVSYFSPEQGRGDRCDSRTDIYALGVVYYELLTGTLPFTGGDATSVIYQHIHTPPRPPKEIDPTVSEDVQAVVLKCMQKLPANRYQTAAELLADLEALSRGQHPATAYTEAGSLRHGGTIIKSGTFAQERRRRVLIAGAAAAVIAALAVAWWLNQGRAGPPANPESLTSEPLAPAPVHAPPASPQPDTAVALAPASTPASTPAPSAPAGGPGDDASLQRAQKVLAAGDFGQARALAEQGLRDHPGSDAWTQLGKAIDQGEGEGALASASAALQRGDMAAANGGVVTAQRLLGSTAAVLALRKTLVDKEGAQKFQSKQLEEAENLISDGNPAKAEELLAKLAADRPGDAAVENALRRAKKMREDQLAIEKAVSGQLEVADQALARKDFDSALIGYTAAKQLDPKSQRASTGVEAVAKVKAEVTVIRDRFEKALKARDLTSAQHELDALRTLVPGSPALVLAENDFSNSKLIEEVQAKANAEKALQLTGQAKELSVRMDDPSQSIPDLEQGLKDFLSKAGVDHPQRGFLERKLEDRRLRLQVVAVLGTLDAAVVQKNIGGIKAVVADAVFASALADLTAYPGLVFSSHLDDFIRTGDRVTVKVSVRHALSVFPERTLSYLYDLHHSEQGWTISGAHLQQR